MKLNGACSNIYSFKITCFSNSKANVINWILTHIKAFWRQEFYCNLVELGHQLYRYEFFKKKKIFFYYSGGQKREKKEKTADSISDPVLLEQYVVITNFKSKQRNQVCVKDSQYFFFYRKNYKRNLEYGVSATFCSTS